jgi:membrane-bound lytic murein transglycosylase A
MQGCTRFIGISLLAFVNVALVGCEAPPKPAPEPEYARPLAPGECALRKLGPGEAWPDLASAWQARDAYLQEALNQDQKWFETPSSKARFPQMFPFADVCTWEQASSSVIAFRQLLDDSTDAAAFDAAFKQLFDCWQTKGWNGKGGVLFTGYYAPEFKASLTRQAGYEYPIYRRPKELETDPVTGKPVGRRVSESTIEPWPGRASIDSSGMLRGLELAWFPTPLDAYIVQVNGSAKLILPDGKVMFIGYAGATDGAYKGLGSSLVECGAIAEKDLNLSAIKRLYEQNPSLVIEKMNLNDRYVFFANYDGKTWPAGSLGVKVTDKTSLATDKSVYPPGGIIFVDTKAATYGGSKQDFKRFMLDQDTGGAILAPGRADIFMGIGPSAEILAGGQYCEGTLYYFFLKPEYVSQYQLPERKPAAKSKSTTG